MVSTTEGPPASPVPVSARGGEMTDPTKPVETVAYEVVWDNGRRRRLQYEPLVEAWLAHANPVLWPLARLSEYERVKAKSESRESELLGMIADLSKQVARSEALEAEVKRLREALETIEKAPAWGYPEKWETTPAEVRQLARKALGASK